MIKRRFLITTLDRGDLVLVPDHEMPAQPHAALIVAEVFYSHARGHWRVVPYTDRHRTMSVGEMVDHMRREESYWPPKQLSSSKE